MVNIQRPLSVELQSRYRIVPAPFAKNQSINQWKNSKHFLLQGISTNLLIIIYKVMPQFSNLQDSTLVQDCVSLADIGNRQLIIF